MPSDRDSTDLPPLRRDGGPTTAVAAANGRGAVSSEAWKFELPRSDGLVRAELPGVLVGRLLGPGDRLSWHVFPEAALGLDHLWDATAVSLDLEFTDGSRLSETPGLTDQYGGAIDPDEQDAAQRLWVDQWNLRTVDLRPALSPGVRREVARAVVVARAQPHRELTIFVDGVDVSHPALGPQRPLDHVRTTRGTQSSSRFSRGNTAPLVAVPHGGVFGLPATDSASTDWPYSWHEHNRTDDNRPALEAFRTSHLPSPWMGDRGVFQVMPSPDAVPDTSPSGRALGFDHAAEIDRPHLYRVHLDGGVLAELTAADFALGMRFTFSGTEASVIVDHHGIVDQVAIDRDGADLVVVLRLDDRQETPPHFVCARISGALEEHLTVRDRTLRGWVVVDPTHPVDVLVGISTVDVETARENLTAAGGFDRMLEEAERRWSEVLDTVDVSNATLDQRISLYSGLYRLFLHPTRYGEAPTGGIPRSRSPYRSVLSRPIGENEGPEIVAGAYSSTNGFWDTYRTAWPLLGLLAPASAGELAQGFVNHHRDSGWTPRWSAPGAEDVMTGTTSDTVFADLLVKDTPGLDLEQAYASAVANATVPSPDPRVGRKGLHPGVFRGYVDTDIPEGMSWSLDNAINDWSISRMAGLLAERHAEGTPRHDRYEAEAEWFARRSEQYRNLFDGDRGFFVGRMPDGSWRVPAADFDPDEWGNDYTETNAWGTAFTVPHDGAGLAELHGGEHALGQALDRFFERPETGSVTKSGSYGFAIHEMTEARDIRRGMLGLSNQPAHHIPFMYCFAGRHDDAHRVVRDALDRLFVGSDYGQGYPGDDDNGEMSAWFILATIGLYPLVPASGTYLLLPPAVTQTVLRPVGGAPITIRVTNPGEGGRFIRSVRVDGVEWNDISIDHARLAAGATVEFELSRTPIGWAAGSRPFSASDLHGQRGPLLDLSADAIVTGVQDAAALVDDTAATVVEIAEGESAEIALVHPIEAVGLYTITVAEPGSFSWVLTALRHDGSSEGCDIRSGELFDRAGQTRVFRHPSTRDEAGSRIRGLRLTANSGLLLRQIEVLG